MKAKVDPVVGWRQISPLDDINELGNKLGVAILHNTGLDILEDSIPDLQPGDIEAGRAFIRHMHHFGTWVKVGIAFPGSPDLQYYSVELFDEDDVELLAQMVRQFDELDRRLALDHGKEVSRG